MRDEVLSQIGTMPFPPGMPISRSLWLIFICRWGFRNPAIMPIDDELGRPEPDNIAGLCDLAASLMDHPMDDETALVVLRRPGSAEISDADNYIFRVMCEAPPGARPCPGPST
ncbi:MAG: hypothetical protein ACLP8X_07115 [Streptosporangiaceae bacterium]